MSKSNPPVIEAYQIPLLPSVQVKEYKGLQDIAGYLHKPIVHVANAEYVIKGIPDGKAHNIHAVFDSVAYVWKEQTKTEENPKA